MAPHPDVKLLSAKVLSKVKCDNTVKVFHNYNLFKPPQNVREYFYYTEINSEWANRK